MKCITMNTHFNLSILLSMSMLMLALLPIADILTKTTIIIAL